MNLSDATQNQPGRPKPESAPKTVPPIVQASIKIGRILDEEDGSFGLEYDDTRGKKNMMRLDALTYEGAIHEARSFLEIQSDDYDSDGTLWQVE